MNVYIIRLFNLKKSEINKTLNIKNNNQSNNIKQKVVVFLY